MEPPAYTLCEKVPDAPPWLSDIGQAEWLAKTEELRARGLLTGVCLSPLGVYCDAYADYRKLAAFVRENGMTYGKEGKWKQARPEVSLMTQKAKLLMSYAKEFGFTPGSQSRIAIVPEKTADVDPLEAAARRSLAEIGTARPS